MNATQIMSVGIFIGLFIMIMALLMHRSFQDIRIVYGQDRLQELFEKLLQAGATIDIEYSAISRPGHRFKLRVVGLFGSQDMLKYVFCDDTLEGAILQALNIRSCSLHE